MDFYTWLMIKYIVFIISSLADHGNSPKIIVTNDDVPECMGISNPLYSIAESRKLQQYIIKMTMQ